MPSACPHLYYVDGSLDHCHVDAFVCLSVCVGCETGRGVGDSTVCAEGESAYTTHFPSFFSSSSSSLPPARGFCRESILKRKCHKVKEGSRGKRKIYTFCLVLGNSRKPKYTHKNNSIIVTPTYIPLCQNHVVLIVH